MYVLLLLILILCLAILICVCWTKHSEHSEQSGYSEYSGGGESPNVLVHITELSDADTQHLQKQYPEIKIICLHEILDPSDTLQVAKRKLSQALDAGTAYIVVGHHFFNKGMLHVPAKTLIHVELPMSEFLERMANRYPEYLSPQTLPVWANTYDNIQHTYRNAGYMIMNPHYAGLHLLWSCEMYKIRTDLISESDWQPKIVHITGPQGVGKSTLATQLKNLQNCTIVDSDDVYFERIHKLQNTKEFRAYITKGDEKFWDLVFLNMEYIKVWRDIVSHAVREHKHLIVLGITVELQCLADYHYVIKLDPEQTYRRRCLRELQTLCANEKGMRQMLEHMDLVKMWQTMYNKYYYRSPVLQVPGHVYADDARLIHTYTAAGYKLLNAKQITERLKKL